MAREKYTARLTSLSLNSWLLPSNFPLGMYFPCPFTHTLPRQPQIVCQSSPDLLSADPLHPLFPFEHFPVKLLFPQATATYSPQPHLTLCHLVSPHPVSDGSSSRTHLCQLLRLPAGSGPFLEVKALSLLAPPHFSHS